MKKLLHILTLSILFSCNISCAMEEWAPEFSVKNIFLLASAVLVAHMVPTGLEKLKFYNGKSAIWHRIKNLLWTQQEILSAVVDQRKWQAEYDRSYNVTELHVACEMGDVEKVSELVQKQDVELNKQRRGYSWHNIEGGTPLHIVCRKGNVSIVSLLCSQQGIKCNALASGEMTPLHDACQHGHIEVVQELLRYPSVDINIRNGQGLAAVDVAYSCAQGYFARFSQHENIVALLLEQEDIDPTGVLALACRYNDQKMFAKILKHKNCIRYLNNNFALYEACAAGNVGMLRVLLALNSDNCMDINKLSGKYNPYNPLHIACKKGSETRDRKYREIVKLLLADPAINVFEKSKESASGRYCYSTAFNFAACCPEMLQLLLEKDRSCISVEWKEEGDSIDTPLHTAIKVGSLSSIRLLCQHGANIFVKNSRGDDAFQCACRQAFKNKEDVYLKIVEALLPSEEYRDSQYLSQCLYKILSVHPGYGVVENIKIINFLLRYGAGPNEKIDPPSVRYLHFPSSIMLAAAERSVSCLNLLVQKGGNYTPHDNNNVRTVLSTAFWQGTIKDFNEIDCLKKIDGNKKREIAIKELEIVVRRAPQIILGLDLQGYNRRDIATPVKKINDFVTMCFRYGNIDSKATTYSYLLASAYQQAAQSKPDSYNADRDLRYYDEPISPYKLKDVIVLALLWHMPAETPEQKMDKAVAIAYQKDPLDYCLMKECDKVELRKHLGRQDLCLNEQNYTLPCVIF